MLAKMLATAILAMMTWSPKVTHTSECKHARRARSVAPLVLRAVEVVREESRSEVDPIVLSAVIVNESGARPGVMGQDEEVGLAQIHPKGMATIHCTDLDWRRSPQANVICGARLLAVAEKRCGGEPGRWLGSYNGRDCGASEYGDRILKLIERGRPAFLASQP